VIQVNSPVFDSAILDAPDGAASDRGVVLRGRARCDRFERAAETTYAARARA